MVHPVAVSMVMVVKLWPQQDTQLNKLPGQDHLKMTAGEHIHCICQHMDHHSELYILVRDYCILYAYGFNYFKSPSATLFC